MQLSIVVITHNRVDKLRRVLTSVLQMAKPPALTMEIVVVCNACIDGSPEMVGELASRSSERIRLINETRLGAAVARNTGVRAAQYEYVAFLDDDVEVEPDYLNEVVKAVEASPDSDAFGGTVKPIWNEPLPSWVATEGPYVLYGALVVRHSPAAEIWDYAPRRVPITANMWFRHRLFDAVGGFDETITYVEDHDFSLRAQRRGFQFRFWPAATVCHPVYAARARLRFILKWYFWAGWWWGYYYRCFDDERCLFGVPMWLMADVVRIPAQCLKPKHWNNPRALVFYLSQTCYRVMQLTSYCLHNRRRKTDASAIAPQVAAGQGSSSAEVAPGSIKSRGGFP